MKARNKAEARDKLMKSMQRRQSPPSALSRYLAYQREEWPEEVERLEADIIELFKSDLGLNVLLTLSKATVEMTLPDGADERALREANAVRNFVFDIRRIVAHG